MIIKYLQHDVVHDNMPVCFPAQPSMRNETFTWRSSAAKTELL